ncbi:acylphosphatase-1-like [Anneissia japonica]|uniref:acylphosphatase-1-like n=1 Tax=Anneissia japonica TaxID=1529436 RepID=UPI001425557F|nr:acylphosphatase-1-like [Anneissia japonica]
MFIKIRYFRNLNQFVNILDIFSRMASSNQNIITSVNFEIHGKVQGVFFRKNTRRTAQKFGLVGWVRNTRHNTVEGQVQGAQDKVNLMKVWLKEKGSKNSVITKADFKNEKEISAPEHEEFVIRQ